MNLLNNNPTNYNTGVNFNAVEPGCWFVGRSLGAGVGTSQNLTSKSVMLYLNYQTGNNISNMAARSYYASTFGDMRDNARNLTIFSG